MLAFLLASLLIELTPGPNMTWLAALGASRGRTAALAAVAGIALGLAFAGAVAGIGLSALIASQPWLIDGLRWAGALYLLYLAYDAWRGRTLLFGGRVSQANLADTWEYDGSNWVQIAPVTSPSGREGASIAFDLGRGVTVQFGGITTTWCRDTVQFVPAALATWSRYGVGCQGAGGVPTLDAATAPGLGSPFVLNLTSLPAQAGAAWLTFGFGFLATNGLQLPLALDAFGLPGCKLWIAPEPWSGILRTHSGGAVSFTLTIPANPALAGLVIGTQALVFDAATPTGLGAVSNAGIMRLQ